MDLKSLYEEEIKIETVNSILWANSLNQQRNISDLPLILQQYLTYCGYTGKENIISFKVDWKNTYLKMATDKGWLSLICNQHNFLPIPSRIVYMKTRLFGIFPFEARDKYQNGVGNMLIKLLKFFTVTDAKGREMDEAELVTILAETILFPLYALQNYITWETIDSRTIKGTICDKGKKVSGTFYFDPPGILTRFETTDRYYTAKGKYIKTKWTAHAENYIEKDGLRFPSEFKAVWHTADGDFEYFKGSVDNIESNLGSLAEEHGKILLS